MLNSKKKDLFIPQQYTECFVRCTYWYFVTRYKTKNQNHVHSNSWM